MIPSLTSLSRPDRETIHPTPVVGVLIVDERRRMLLLRSGGRYGDRWVVPTGHVMKNEGLLEALRRETRRETNLEIDRIRFLGVREQVSPLSHFLVIEYGAVALTTDVVHGREYSDAGWFTRSEISTMDLADFTRAMIYEHSFACMDLVQPERGPSPGAKLKTG